MDTTSRTDATAPGATAPSPAQRQRQFERFAATECGDDPLYVALCRLLAQRPAALAWLAAAPLTQQRPNLLLAAIHERVLAGAGGALADYFPSRGGERLPDDGLATALDAFLAAQSGALASHCATRSTQTNEIGRCAVLWPALAELAARCGQRPLALLDFGCSAGLNLGVDAYAYVHGDRPLGAPAGDGVPLIPCHPVHGAGPRALPPARIASRIGLDPAPVDLHDAAATRWLRACLWPHDRQRAQRFDQAAEIVRRAGWPVRQADDCSAQIEPWLDSLPPGVQPVVFNSWVLAYFEPAARDAHIERMRALVRRRGLAWLSAEGPGLVLGDAPPSALPGDARVGAAELANASLWYLSWRDEAGGLRTELLARSHPHGRWAHWTGTDA